MSDVPLSSPPERKPIHWRDRFHRLIASPRFQAWAARFPLTKGQTRREGEAMFDLVAGFVHSQCLAALVELRLLHRLMEGAQSVPALSRMSRVPEARMRVLLRAGEALGLVRLRDDHVRLTRRGAAMTGVQGLDDMIRHHGVLYRDLSDPVAFFRGETETELSTFWPYVFGAGAAKDPETAQRYSTLMSESQALVAAETLAATSFSNDTHLMDVGGGTGAFLTAALRSAPRLKGTLFDLPAVVDGVRFADISGRVSVVPGSFQDDPLPKGANVISLVRVLYDHGDDTVARLLLKVFDTLPPGGRLVVSEPMLGNRAGDAYFAVYTLAMNTGRTRSAAHVTELLEAAGFVDARERKTNRPFVTSVVEAFRP